MGVYLMSEENKELNEQQNLELEKIQELMEKVDQMIDPEEYKELEKKYNTLLNDYINKRPAKKEPKQTIVRPAAEIANDIRNIKDGDVTNREYWELSIEYRDAFLKETGKDPWSDGMGDATDQTEKVANTVKQLLRDYENPVSFRTQFNELIQDDPNVIRALRDRNKKNKK